MTGTEAQSFGLIKNSWWRTPLSCDRQDFERESGRCYKNSQGV